MKGLLYKDWSILISQYRKNIGSSNFSVVFLICNCTLHALLHR